MARTNTNTCRMLPMCLLLLVLFFCVSSEADIIDRFFKFIDDFRKPYKNGTQEFLRRLEIFKVCHNALDLDLDMDLYIAGTVFCHFCNGAGRAQCKKKKKKKKIT